MLDILKQANAIATKKWKEGGVPWRVIIIVGLSLAVGLGLFYGLVKFIGLFKPAPSKNLSSFYLPRI